MNKVINSSRKIKQLGNIHLKKGERFLHPLTLQVGVKTDNNPEYASELYYKNGKPQFTKESNKYIKYSKKQLQTFMALPYLNLSTSNLLNIYEINSSDDLIDFIITGIQNNIPYNNLYRIINIWIYDNFYDLQKYNNILLKIIEIINTHIWKYKIDKDIINNYIKLWFTKVDINDFNFNFIDNIKFNIK
jgi:hypothetical protein